SSAAKFPPCKRQPRLAPMIARNMNRATGTEPPQTEGAARRPPRLAPQSSPAGSEGEFAHYLENAGVGCGRSESAVGRCRRLHGVQDGSERALAQVGDRIGEVRVIEDVVGVGPQGEGESLVQAERLLQAQVAIEVARAAERVARDGAEG